MNTLEIYNELLYTAEQLDLAPIEHDEASVLQQMAVSMKENALDLPASAIESVVQAARLRII